MLLFGSDLYYGDTLVGLDAVSPGGHIVLFKRSSPKDTFTDLKERERGEGWKEGGRRE